MTGFCGETVLLDVDLLLNNTWPEFSPCFHHTVLVWVPCGWLWLTLPAFLRHILSLQQHLQLTKLTIAKLVLIAGMLTCVIGDVIRVMTGETGLHNISTSFYTADVLKLATYILSITLTVLSRRRGLSSSCPLYIFWLLHILCDVIPFYTLIIQWQESSTVEMCLFYLHYGFLLLQIILCSFADNTDHIGDDTVCKRIPCPALKVSFLNRLTFSWTFSTLWKGWKRPLQNDDVYDLPPFLKSEATVPPFLESWQRERQRAARLNNELSRYLPRERQNLLEFSEDIDQSQGRKKTLPDVIIKEGAQAGKPQTCAHKPSLLRTLFRTSGFKLMKSHLFRIVSELVLVLNPYLLKRLMYYIENKESEPEWQGYGIVIGFVFVSVMLSMLQTRSFFTAENVALGVRTALMSAVYKKALTMNNESRKKYTTGEIVNLMSVDVQRVESAVMQMWIVWSAPIIFIICFYQLYQVLGLAFLAGVVIMVVLFPFQYKLSMYHRDLFNHQLKHKDARLKNMGELLNGIKVLKLYAWEGSFRDKIMAIREKEMKVVMKIALFEVLLVFLWIGFPTLITIACFVTYIMTSPTAFMSSQTAFVSIALFNYLRGAMNMLPMCISTLAQASLSTKRLNKYLAEEDLDPSTVSANTAEGVAISIDKATFTWSTGSESTLKNINLSVPTGQLVAIVGSVGAGKSSLLSAMLGEMRKLKGHVAMQRSVAYVPQEAWIQNLSLKANIVFGSETDNKRYLDVIKACALESDLETLPGGANTEIGEKGINLSGGQKQRVSLARAVYSDKDIYLMDDPLSAVDSHVGKHIFSHVIGHQGMLKDKTRVLVTHGVHWLPMVDVIVVVDQGEITEVGSYEELLDHDGPFAQFLKTYLLQGKGGNLEEEEVQEIRSTLSKNSVSSHSLSPSKISDYLHSPQLPRQLSEESETNIRQRHHNENLFGSVGSLASCNMDGDLNREVFVADGATVGEEYKLIEDEYTETGNVRYSILKSYFSVIGWVSAAGIMVLYIIYNFAWAMSNIWLSHWTEDPSLKTIAHLQARNYTSRLNSTGNEFNITGDSSVSRDKLQSLSYYYLGVYCAIALTQAVSVMLNSLLVYVRMVEAAKVTHKNLLDNIIKQPMSFFDTTPTGRILNRFTKDVDVVDGHLPRVLRLWLEFIFYLISILVVISYSTPMFLGVAVPVIICFIFIQRMYTPTSRQLRRYFSASKSPVFSHFTETIHGASSVRAFMAQDRFFNSSLQRVNEHNVFYYGAVTTHRWMKMRLDALGCLVMFGATLLGVVSPHISPGDVGLSITYALMVTGCLVMMVIMTTELETHVVSVERMAQYTSLPTEAAWVIQQNRPSPEWPESGHIKFDNLKIRYRPELDLVLKGISCDIKPGEKIGVVGRTGAGKSSLTLALFRILEADEGRILVDGHDIADIGLHDLRSRLTILPQEPMLFSGTLRLNLDPFEKHSDEDLWLALERAHLKDFVSGLSEGLLHECEEGGHNLSVGQRQLVCLARTD
ncbi:ATP-binding cassette sub-family C member 2-like isoform X2 [Haliotis rufescens]|uniref:ATP-binding cassette sub-family C member 2-like isoform X2 n=1 Tax=Haliotis rufescens TaxID=6454 RepID=UPI00201FB238|nr:ATP-binding cassette sub-family C member 2-like isoform X2 [Haliotis rufescens]